MQCSWINLLAQKLLSLVQFQSIFTGGTKMGIRMTPSQGSMCWNRATTLPDDGTVEIDRASVEELLQASRILEQHSGDANTIDVRTFDLPNCRALAERVRVQLDEEIGFAVIEGFPLEDISHETAIKLYWLFASQIKRPVAQNWDGKMIWDVRDTGQKPAAGNGIRSSQSNYGQSYHTDNCCALPPEYVCLLCFQPAKEGGVSGLISFDTVYNMLLDNDHDLLPRLYQSFYFDRQRDFGPDDLPYSSHAVFEEYEGQIFARFDTDQVRNGYVLAGVPMDAESSHAIDRMFEVMETSDAGKLFDFRRGQIQIVNNRKIGHRRTAYVDWPELDRRRHLVRLWLRDHGSSAYMG